MDSTPTAAAGKAGPSGGARSDARPPVGSRALITHWAPSIVFGVLAPLVTYLGLTGAGMGDLPALVLATLWPLVDVALVWALRRRIDEFGMFSAGYLVLGIVTSLLLDSPELLLVKRAVLTGLFGLVLLGSLAAPRPLGFYFGRKFGTDGSPAGVAWWNGLWRHPTFRRSQYVITTGWGVVFVLEALLQILLVFTLSVSAMSIVSFLSPLIVFPALGVFTVVVARRARASAPVAAASPPKNAVR